MVVKLNEAIKIEHGSDRGQLEVFALLNMTPLKQQMTNRLELQIPLRE